MITNRVLMGCFVVMMLNVTTLWYFQHQEQQKKQVRSLMANVNSQFYAIDYYGNKVNKLSEVVDQYECQRAGKKYIGQNCSENAPDAAERQALGPELFTGIVVGYRTYQQYGVDSVMALNQLIPYENADFKAAVSDYQKWFIDQQNTHYLPVQGFAEWNTKFKKLASNS